MSEENPNAGEMYALTCTATVVENLIATPDLNWLDPRGAVPDNQNDEGITSTRTLIFSPLRTSQGEVYRCRAVIVINSISLDRSNEISQTVTVQSKSSSITCKVVTVSHHQYLRALMICKGKALLRTILN